MAELIRIDDPRRPESRAGVTAHHPQTGQHPYTARPVRVPPYVRWTPAQYLQRGKDGK